MTFAAFKERAQRVARDLTGHRFMFGAVAVGGQPPGRPGAGRSGRATALAGLGRGRGRRLAGPAVRRLAARPRQRAPGCSPTAGRCAPRHVGARRPRQRGARATLREDAPAALLPGLPRGAARGPDGDVAARMEARAVELAATFAMLDELLSAPIRARGRGRPGRPRRPTAPGGWRAPAGET